MASVPILFVAVLVLSTGLSAFYMVSIVYWQKNREEKVRSQGTLIHGNSMRIEPRNILKHNDMFLE